MAPQHELDDQEVKSIAITWQVVAGAFGAILLSIFTFVFITTNNRVGSLEASFASRGERLALLESRNAVEDQQIEKITQILEKLDQAIADMRYDHIRILEQQAGIKPLHPRTDNNNTPPITR